MPLYNTLFVYELSVGISIFQVGIGIWIADGCTPTCGVSFPPHPQEEGDVKCVSFCAGKAFPQLSKENQHDRRSLVKLLAYVDAGGNRRVFAAGVGIYDPLDRIARPDTSYCHITSG